MDNELQSLRKRISELERSVWNHLSESNIFKKAFRVIGLHSDFVEFGTYRGDSLVSAYWEAKNLYKEYIGDRWNMAQSDKGAANLELTKNWEAMKFYAFDSFQGIPEPKGPDKDLPVFHQGDYLCSEQDFRDNLEAHQFDMRKLHVFPGFFEV